jgi:hypothetical protein
VVIFPFLPSASATVYRRLGPKWAALTLALPFGLLAVLVEGGLMNGIWLLQWLAIGPILMECLGRIRRLERAVGAALGATLGLQALLLGAAALDLGEAPWTAVRLGVEASVRKSLEVYGQMGLDPEALVQLRATAPALSHVLFTLVPGLVVGLDLFLLWWTLLVTRKVAVLWGGEGSGPEGLSAWAMPFPWVWLTISGGVFMLLPGEIFFALGINLLLVMGTVHLLQGIGVVATLFRQRRVPQFLRGTVYALIFLQQVFLLAVVAIGLFDVWFDFRRRWAPRVQP